MDFLLFYGGSKLRFFFALRAIFLSPAQGMGGRRREEGRWEPGFFCFRPVQIFDIAAGSR